MTAFLGELRRITSKFPLSENFTNLSQFRRAGVTNM